MADVEAAFTAILLGDAGVSGLVADRVHWLRQPDQVDGWPYINLRLVSGRLDYTLDGASGLEFARVQVDCWAKSTSADGGTKGLTRAVVDALPPPGEIVSGVTMHSASVAGTRDLPAQVKEGARPLFGRSVDILFGWSVAE